MDKYLGQLAEYMSSISGNDAHFAFVLLAISFLGGLIASLSPCSLSMLPIIIGYVGGYSKESPIKTLFQMSMFILGTAIVFSVIGLICAVTGKVFVGVAGGYFMLVMASLLLVMGLKLFGILDFELPVIIKKIPSDKNYNIYLYPVILGSVFALVGTPCSTPILAGIMAFASLSANILLAVSMLFLFSLGQGLILVIAAVFTSGLKNMRNFAKVSNVLMKMSGILLITASVYLFYKVFSPFGG